MQSPLVGVSPNVFPAEDRHFYKLKELEYGDANIARSLRVAGALPVMLYRAAALEDAELESHARALIERVHGLVLTGGADLSPTSYGETPLQEAWGGDRLRDRWEMALYGAALAAGRPVLGICRGVQLMNVAEGGTLWQDLPSLRPATAVHRSQEKYCKLTHGIRFEPGSQIEALFADDERLVNTVHHQGLREVAACFRATAWSPDGVVEAIEREGSPWVLGVQWHPEWMAESPAQQRLVQCFVTKTSEVAL
jgi:putative glutamine amidotransferase